MAELGKAIVELINTLLKGTYKRLWIDLNREPLHTLLTLFILGVISSGVIYAGLVVYTEVTKQEAHIIVPNGLDAADQYVKTAPSKTIKPTGGQRP